MQDNPYNIPHASTFTDQLAQGKITQEQEDKRKANHYIKKIINAINETIPIRVKEGIDHLDVDIEKWASQKIIPLYEEQGYYPELLGEYRSQGNTFWYHKEDEYHYSQRYRIWFVKQEEPEEPEEQPKKLSFWAKIFHKKFRKESYE